jgi:sortase A
MASDLRERVGARHSVAGPPPPTRRVRAAILRTAGVLFLLAGLAVLGLLAWQLWGTGFATERAQNVLRRQLNTELADPAVGSGTSLHPRVAVVPPPSRGRAIAELRIPKIDLDMVVVEGTSAAELATGPGHYVGTAYPWEGRGTVGIAGHRTTYLHPFWALDRLRPGDRITLTTLHGTFVYAVTGSRTVLPQDVWVLNDTQGPTLVLTTCTPRFSASHRLVVFARSVQAPPAPGEARAAPAPTSNEPRADSTQLLAGDPAPVGSRGAEAFLLGLGVVGLLLGAAWRWSSRRRRRSDRRTVLGNTDV